MAEIRTGNTKERLPGRWFGLAALSVSALVLGLDITILITALPTLSAKLDATTDQLQWMSAAYTLSLAGFMLPAGVRARRPFRPPPLVADRPGHLRHLVGDRQPDDLGQRAHPHASGHGRERRHRPATRHFDPALDV